MVANTSHICLEKFRGSGEGVWIGTKGQSIGTREVVYSPLMLSSKTNRLAENARRIDIQENVGKCERGYASEIMTVNVQLVQDMV